MIIFHLFFILNDQIKIQNLLISQRCLEVLLDISFMRTIDTLLTNKWNDSLIKESLNFIYDYLDKNYKFLKYEYLNKCLLI